MTRNFLLRRRCWAAAIAVALLLALGLLPALGGAQTAAFNRDVVVLDPAHGGADGGARISDSVQEKDVTLEVATRLRALLTARGFTVVATRDGAAGAGSSSDQRAEAANKAHAVACLVIHASASGNGVLIGTSAIGSAIASPIAGIAAGGSAVQSGSIPPGAVPWERAQEGFVPQSLLLANKVGAALARASVPLTIRPVAERPLDNLMCPAAVIELAPMAGSGDPAPVSDAMYQQRVAEAIAGALVFWRNQAQPPEFVTLPRPDARMVEPAKPSSSPPARRPVPIASLLRSPEGAR